MRRPAARRRRAFSLVELLVVIAILSLLVALLVPSLGRAKQLAQAAVCRSNLHQMGNAMKAYITAWHYYPCGHTWDKSHYWPYAVITWAPQMRMYAPGTGIFWCPSSVPEAKWQVTYPGSGDVPKEYGYEQGEQRLYSNTPFSYGYNNWGTADFLNPQVGLGSMTDYTNPGDPDWGPLPATRVQQPWDMLAVADSRVDYSWDAFIDSNQPLEYPYDPHLGRSNILLADGAVDGMYVADLIADTDAAQKRWNNDHRRQ